MNIPDSVHKKSTHSMIRRVPVTIFIVSIVCCLMVFCACQPRQTMICNFPNDLLYNAGLDSIGLTDFQQLTTAQQQVRRRQAQDWLQRSQSSIRLDAEIRALRNSVGLAPDQPEVWLELAEAAYWTGDYLDERSYLDVAWQGVLQVQREKRRDLRNQIAQAFSWHYYRRGEWRKGMAWSDTSMVYGIEDLNSLQIRGLLLACYGQKRYAEDVARNITRRDVFASGGDWVRGMSDWGQDWYEEASHGLSNFRPDDYHRAESQQDIGMIEEHLGHLEQARNRYEHAAAALPFSDHSCFRKRTFRILSSPRKRSEMPVWLAFDRYFLVGSLSAYTALANWNFENALTAVERGFWAEAAIDAASICIRKKIDITWAQAVRGVIFAKLERFGLARQDLQRVIQKFDRKKYEHAAALAWLGHVHLKEESFGSALPILRRAVAADPQGAVAWSDLGLALIKAGNMDEAVQALDTAITIDPELAVAWYNRGLTHFHAKRWPEAVADLSRAIELAPDNSAIQQILQRAIIMEQRTALPEEPDNE